MRSFITTLGAAAVIGFAGLGLATSASASPAPVPLSTGTLTAVHGGFAQDNGSDRASDRILGCLQRARLNAYFGPPLPVAGRWGCSANSQQ